MNPQISVVIATRDRAASVARLLAQLDAQTLAPAACEVIVIDDGSAEPVAPLLQQVPLRATLTVRRIAWSGQAAARHQGAELATGDILVILDDDMQIAPGFLEAQLARHAAVEHAVVLGRISPDPSLSQMPLFERYHARQLERWRQDVLAGRVAVDGLRLCTGNVSMRRVDYFAVGGFDTSLQRSEDRELGIRLEQHGCQIVYADEVESVHSSDHASFAVWRRRAYLYGRFDRKIAVLHPTVQSAHPWKFWALIHPLSRPLVAISLVAPVVGRALSQACYAVAATADKVGFSRLGLMLTAFCYAFEYFAGLRDECGSFSALRADIRSVQPARMGVIGHFTTMCAAVRADHESIRRYRQKYNGEEIPSSRLFVDLVMKVGFQIMAWYRLMRFFDASRIPVLPMIVSRLIRHLYGADIHWKARIEPGISIVHGVGLVLSGLSSVESGCILFHHVTLGESIDPISGKTGAPRLGRDVHVGPGATLLGPIVVGDSTKIGAGAVLMRSVAPGSLVMQPDAVVTSRRAPKDRAMRRMPQPAA
jgi:serine acetyltransferase/glycosyltransferase involved in cell wall biosynthesis